MLEQYIRRYNEAVYDTDRDLALAVIHDAVAGGVPPQDVIFKIVVPAIEQMIKSISEDFDSNLAQHFMTSQIAMEVTEEMLSPASGQAGGDRINGYRNRLGGYAFPR